VKIWAVTLMLNVLRDFQGAFSASALQDIQEMDISAPHSLLEVCIVSLIRLEAFVATKSDQFFSGDNHVSSESTLIDEACQSRILYYII
jgi:hypothetical protein